jgi:Recombination endonuclease VII
MGCKKKGCDRMVVAKGLCRRHYTAQWREGNAAYHARRKVQGAEYFQRRLQKLSPARAARMRAEHAAYQRQWRELHLEKVRAGDRYGQRYLRMYGLTVATYNAMLEAQGGVCAICGQPPGRTRLSVDHDHRCCSGPGSCGKCVRGLLHEYCNRALGLFRDDPLNLRAAAEYLEHYRLLVPAGGSQGSVP